MFRVKICGVTTADDARLAADAGADAIGINFYPDSPRYCTIERAREIAAAVPPHVCKVGVFVNAPTGDVRRAFAEVPLDAVQFCGGEPPEFLREVRPAPIVRAARIGTNVDDVVAYLEGCHRQQAMPRMLLCDAKRDGHYGGTGTTLDWEMLAANRTKLRGLPLVLAGGLTPDNVHDAVGIVRPWAVDVASGVESAPGVKSPKLVKRFVTLTREALARASHRHP
ncbi:MAG: phosphoribosylanthranilate isomerase [Planctomycetota bacterium]|nr:MAG: phosphoribosylanthranilate isomerase [Planctomycetota bacterium]